MTDNLTPEKRKYNMRRIRSSNTKPEEKVRKYLYSKGFRYRKNDRRLPGCPDIVLPKYKTVILVNGCFWHKHDCSKFVWPSSNKDYWVPKIRRNVERDKRNMGLLMADGWRVIVVWECEVKRGVFLETMNRVISEIMKGDLRYGTSGFSNNKEN